MARLSRKERARRLKISRGVKRYWRQVKQLRKAAGYSTDQARSRLRTVPSSERFTFVRQARERRAERRVDLAGEYAFNLKDRDEEEGFNLYSTFRGQDTVRLSVSYEYRESVGAPVQYGDRDIEFSRGDSEEEFWSNYYAAIREYHDEVVGGGKYEGFAIFVSAAA